jgi:hypothetical protein
MSKNPNFFQRKYLVNKKFQLPFMGRMVMINLLLIGGLYLLTTFIYYRFNYLGDKLGLPSDHSFYHFVQEQILYLSIGFAAMAILSTVCLCIYGLFLSHRIAGPLENIKVRYKEMEQACKEQNFEALKCAEFRDDDFFHEFAQAFNQHVETVKNISTEDTDALIKHLHENSNKSERTLKLVTEEVVESEKDSNNKKAA